MVVGNSVSSVDIYFNLPHRKCIFYKIGREAGTTIISQLQGPQSARKNLQQMQKMIIF